MYYNPIFVMGVERFAAAAAAAGVDAVLTVDLPLDELDELRLPLAAQGVGVIPLVAPTSTPERIARVRAVDPAFVYYISLTGVTGAAFDAARLSAARVDEIRAATGAPVVVGFGIKTADDVRAWHDHVVALIGAHDVAILQPPKLHRDGATSFYFRDPAGNKVQIIHIPTLRA